MSQALTFTSVQDGVKVEGRQALKQMANSGTTLSEALRAVPMYENAFNASEKALRAEDGISTELAYVEQLRKRYAQRIAQLNTLRQSLLQKAFAGELS